MIVNRLDRAETLPATSLLFSANPAFAQAFAFLRRCDLPMLPSGKIVIDDERMFCIISNGQGRQRAEAKLEAHRRYIDVHYIIAGTDEMGWKATADCTIPDRPYDSANDVEFFQDEPASWTTVPAGSFTVFFPQDAHAPLVGIGVIHKAVVKIAVE